MVVCFLGHRKIKKSVDLVLRLYKTIYKVIAIGADTFLFGSKSEFDALCLRITSKLKHRYPHIRRVYVRAEYPEIDEEYRAYLLQFYDDTYFAPDLIGAGKGVYIRRNSVMIDASDICIFYYDATYRPACGGKGERSPKSGTEAAYNYARSKCKKIVNVFC